MGNHSPIVEYHHHNYSVGDGLDGAGWPCLHTWRGHRTWRLSIDHSPCDGRPRTGSSQLWTANPGIVDDDDDGDDNDNDGHEGEDELQVMYL